MGAVGLTFVIVAVFLGFIVKRGGQLDPGAPGAPGTEAELVDQDAAPTAAATTAAPPDAGTVNAAAPSSAAPSDDDPDASAPDGAPLEPVASGLPAKKPPPTKTKYKPPPKWRRHR